MIQDPKTGLWYRAAKGELHIIKEQGLYGGLDFKGRVCLDIGANIGAFVQFARARGAAYVAAYEPFPDTFAVLRKNFGESMFVSCREAGITRDGGPHALYLSRRFPAGHTMRPTRGRPTVVVDTVSYKSVLEELRPSLLKIDCEGAEYNFLTEPVPDYVEEVGMELHLRDQKELNWALQMIARFGDWHYHKNFRLNWTTTMLIVSRHRPGMGLVRDRLRELLDGKKAII